MIPTMLPEPVSIINYDINRFEYITVREEESLRTIDDYKRNGIDYKSIIKQNLISKLSTELLNHYKDNIKEYFKGGDPFSGKMIFSLKILIEKPQNNN